MLKDVHGRTAVAASAAWNLAKTLMQLVVFWAFFLLVLPAIVFLAEGSLGLAGWRFDPHRTRVLGWCLFALGGTLGVASGILMAVHGRGTPLPFDAPRELVVVGPYRFIRNPMAVAGLSQGVAVGLILGSPAVIVYALSGGPLWNFLVRPWEELDLEQRFGEPYRHYRRSVHCWLPRCTPYRAPSAGGPVADADPPRAEGEQP